MHNFRFMYLTDTQFSDRNPEGRKDDFGDTCLEKLKEVVDRALEMECVFVIHGGDLFMHARPSSFRMMYEVSKLISGSGFVWLFNQGNHDLIYRQHSSYPHTGLGMVSLLPNVYILPHDRVVNLGKILDGLGGLGTEMLRDVNIHAHWFSSGVDREESSEWGYKERSRYPRAFLIRMVHGMLLDAKGPFGKDQTLLRSVNTEADVFLGSHYHPGWGPTKVEHTVFVNPGSLLRWPRPAHDKVPQVAVFDVWRKPKRWKVSTKLVPLKVAKPTSEIFLEKEEGSDLSVGETNEALQEFLSQLSGGRIRRDPEAIRDAVLRMARKQGVKPAVRVKLRSVLDAAVEEMR